MQNLETQSSVVSQMTEWYTDLVLTLLTRPARMCALCNLYPTYRNFRLGLTPPSLRLNGQYNVERNRKRKTTSSLQGEMPVKRGRPKKILNLASRYPTLCCTGVEESSDRNKEALRKEMEKEIPRKDIVMSLMKDTFMSRRKEILRSDMSVLSKLDKYPALKMPPIVSF